MDEGAPQPPPDLVSDPFRDDDELESRKRPRRTRIFQAAGGVAVVAGALAFLTTERPATRLRSSPEPTGSTSAAATRPGDDVTLVKHWGGADGWVLVYSDGLVISGPGQRACVLGAAA